MAITGTDINVAKEFLTKGELVAIPTETVYGLAGNALNDSAVLSIFEVKNRPAFDPLIIHTDSLEKAVEFVNEFPEKALLLAKHFWPGPLTLLLPKKQIIPDLVTSGLDNVAVRIPNHPLLLALLRSLPFPLAAPSANPFGYISPTNAAHVNAQLGEKIPYILNGGESEVGIESTIVGFENDEPVVYRLGGLAVEDIEAIVGKVKLMPHSSSNPKAPGMLKSHYAPRKPLYFNHRGAFLASEEMLTGYLLFDEYLENIDRKYQRILSKTGDMKEAAHNLFAYLRELDMLPIQQIRAEFVPMNGLGLAINDRLQRAAARE
ncbi:L-threonylcarbamoyladenylate synthase [Dyadobacter chenwenxiniae]|uniref:Threonylcarbamoyl-AMP synthase n=1 Tax=Dyadobacter chenwenxiniae TaxID=2906456 RepID=A0A9X1TFA7_9BACT|nr:L-threonylcarbamoyladenylate synthase [Dyadobacter chenwenxiniae]MCF0062409.1 threonylcarbamoyl-AMP synthase [Dyadobacter chenwenxiniae]UON86456.1 L-threonylcarbamoyladenylate synthase [Dyadobacter chenwenxiniae]